MATRLHRTTPLLALLAGLAAALLLAAAAPAGAGGAHPGAPAE